MAGTITAQEFASLRDFIEKHCGIHLEPEKSYLVESRLTALMAEAGCETFSALHQKAVADATCRLKDKIVDAMTTNETLWFRDSGPFETLRELFDGFAADIKGGRRSRVRVWAAACSTGQEPYSIAMTALESGRLGSGLRPEQVEILATDISPTALFMAQAGRYDAVAMSRGLPQEMRDRYFKQNGRVWTIQEDVKKMVSFKKMNLQESFSWIGGRDIVFCRNVLIYFSETFKRDILSRLCAVLEPRGLLFVGASEAVSSYSQNFVMLKNSHGLYYQVRQRAKP